MFNFTLVQKGDKLLNTPVTLSANVQKNSLFVDHNKLSIHVREFMTDNLIAQGEFYKLMKVEQFPKMEIELISFESNDAYTDGIAILNITITDVTRKYEFPVNIGKEDGLMRIDGKKRISIKDFGLCTSKTLLGMVKINDMIEIVLNMRCKLNITNEDMADHPVR